MSRRQTLGVLSPSQLNARSTGAQQGPSLASGARVASTSTKEPLVLLGVSSNNNNGAAGSMTASKAQATAAGRKSLAPDKAAMLLLANGANMNGSSVGAGGGGGALRTAIPQEQQMQPLADSMARRSSAHATKAGAGFSTAGAGGPKADPRPLSDRGFQANCTRTIITYLSTHNYPHAVSPKTLASPTAKDFTLIIQFLQQQFDPNLRTFGKIEDDVPLFFKRLNYPFQIPKSALFAVGSPHSWPAVLAAITWLVELLNYNERIEASARLQQQLEATGGVGSPGGGLAAAGGAGPGVLDDPDAATRRQFFEFICTSYRYFLAGDDPRCMAVEQEMVSQFSSKEQLLADAYDRLKQANDEVLSDIKRLQTEPSPLVVAQQRLAERQQDQHKFEQLLENLQGLKVSLQRKIQERQEELASRSEALAAAQRENEALRQRIAAQPVSKQDLSRMVLERSKQKEVLDAATSHAEELERKMHEQDVQLVSLLKSLEGGASRYNQAVHRLRLAPASSKRAGGVAYELRLNRDALTPSEFSNVDLKGVIRPGIEHLCDLYRTKAAQLSRDLLGLKEAVASSQEALLEKQQENRQLEAQIEKLDQQLARVREESEHRVRELAGRAAEVKQDAEVKHSAATAKVAEWEGRKAAAQQELEQCQRTCELELNALKVELRMALEAMLQHRVHIKQLLAGTLAVVGEEQRQLAALPVPC